MRYFFVLILLVVHTSVCQKITKKVRRSVTAAADPIYNATCKNIKCTGDPDPMCVKLKYAKSHWPEVGDKTVYIVMFSRCEMQYVNCHKGIKAIEMPMKNCEHGEHKKPSKKRDLGKDQKSRSKRSAAKAPKRKEKAHKKRSLLRKTKGKVIRNQIRRVVNKMRLPHKRSKRQVQTDDEGANQLSDGEEPMRRYHNVLKQSKGQTYASLGKIKDNVSPKRTRPEIYQISKGDNNSNKKPMFGKQVLADKSNNMKLKDKNGNDSEMFKNPMFAQQNRKLKNSQAKKSMLGDPMFATNSVKQLKNYERNHQENEKLNHKGENGQVTGEPMFRKPMFAANANHKFKQSPKKPMFAKKKNVENDQGENERASGEPMLRKPIAHRGKLRANNKQASRKPIFRHRALANSKKQKASNRGKHLLRNKKLGKKKGLRADDDASLKQAMNEYVEGKPMSPLLQQAFLDPKYNASLQSAPASPAKVNGEEDGDGDGDLEEVVGEGQDFEQPLRPSHTKIILPPAEAAASPAKVNGEENGDGDRDLEEVEGEGQDFEQPLRPRPEGVVPPNKVENGGAVADEAGGCDEEEGDGQDFDQNTHPTAPKEKSEQIEVPDEDGDIEDVEGEGQDFDQPLVPANPGGTDTNGKQDENTEIINPIAQNHDVVQDDEVIEEGTGQDPEEEDEDEKEVATATEAVDEEQYKADCPTVCPARDVMLCARCTHGVYRTFSSVCHMRMFNCKQPDEKLELVSRQPCVMSAPYLNDMRVPKGGVSEPHDEDVVLRYFKCKVQRGIKNSSSKCEFNGAVTETKLVGGRD